MEDEDITSNAYQLIQPVWAESRASVHYTGIWCTGTTFCLWYRLDQLHVFGAVSLSSILRAYLYTTYSSTVHR